MKNYLQLIILFLSAYHPGNPPFEITPEIFDLYGQALYNLGMLNETSKRIPDINGFIEAYIKKEAILSSEIEGIHTTLMDLFVHDHHDKPQKKDKNRQLVTNYTNALNSSIEMMQSSNLPICSRVILAAHKTLLSDGDSDKASPGQYRKQTVTVGNLVPAQAPLVPQLMSDLEKFINEDTSLPPLIKAGLAHVQFETIHPFLDGNGRIGRLLIMLMLLDAKLLHSPILYISYYFKKHHLEYYLALDRVRTHGDFEGWIIYYLKAVNHVAIDANRRAKDIEALELRLRQNIETDPLFATSKKNALLLLKYLFVEPIASVTQMSNAIDKVYNTANSLIAKFVQAGILSKVPGDAPYLKDLSDKRIQYYIFTPYIDLLNKEYE